MTEQIRLRIDSQLAEEAEEVCREIGISPTAAVSMLFALSNSGSNRVMGVIVWE